MSKMALQKLLIQRNVFPSPSLPPMLSYVFLEERKKRVNDVWKVILEKDYTHKKRHETSQVVSSFSRSSSSFFFKKTTTAKTAQLPKK